MAVIPEDIIKILLSVFAGGLIGIEREFRDKAAGFRTLIFICAGATLFTIFSDKLAGDNDPNRIAANIVTGVGFLGAGVILRNRGRVIGLTTAATIWITAAVGMGIGGGEYTISGIMVLLAIAVLWLFPYIEHCIDNVREERTYEVACSNRTEQLERLKAIFRESGLRIQSHRQTKVSDKITSFWHTSGSPKKHNALVQRLFDEPEINEVRF